MFTYVAYFVAKTFLFLKFCVVINESVSNFIDLKIRVILYWFEITSAYKIVLILCLTKEHGFYYIS